MHDYFTFKNNTIMKLTYEYFQGLFGHSQIYKMYL